MRLLLWLLLPICVLHLVLTPGALIFPGSDWPFTWEGANRAVWLSTRLFFLFFSAMVLSRLLSLDEWQAQFCRIPIVGRHLYPYLELFPSMQDMTVNLARKHWRKSRLSGVSRLPESIAGLLEDVVQSGREQAKVVWTNWEGELPSCAFRFDRRALALIIMGIFFPFAAWVT